MFDIGTSSQNSAQSSDSGLPSDSLTGDGFTSNPASNQRFAGSVTNRVHQQLVFVDAAADNFAPLIDSLEPSQVVLLEAQKNGITQISEALSQYINAPLKGIHIISKGNRGRLQVGNTQLSQDSLTGYTDALTEWSKSLTGNADILLYGSNIAKGEQGQAFINELALLTEADIAASNNLSRRMGDWDLEETVGSVETPSVVAGFNSDHIKSNLTLSQSSLVAPLTETPLFSREIPAGYSGYNVNATVIDWQNGSAGKLAAATKKISGDGDASTRILRLPGGSVANYWDWQTGGVTKEKISLFEANSASKGIVIPPGVRASQGATIPQIDTFLDKTKADSVWVVNMLTSSLNDEIETLKQALNAGVSIKGIELGNELYFNIGSYTGRSAKSKEFKGFRTPADYAITAKTWARAIKRNVTSEIPIALTGAPNNISNPRSQAWNAALVKKRGPDQKSAVDIADAITLHPYYTAADLGVTTADIGNTRRAGQIARKSITELRSILSGDMDASQAGLQLSGGIQDERLKNEALWITEHNILERNTQQASDRIILGNSWLHSLMVDLNTHEFLKDPRTQMSLAHVLVGSPQWQALVTPGRREMNGNQRGQFQPFKESQKTDFQTTATGFVLGKSAEVLNNGGEGTLLDSGDAFIAWQIENISNKANEISAVNAGDTAEAFQLPELPTNRKWKVSLYTDNPWDTPNVNRDLIPTVIRVRGNSQLTVPPFTKVVATAVR